MNKKNLISIIIATYNRCDSLKDTLNSLLRQECDGTFNYEIIIVDNNSKDKTKETVEKYLSEFKGRLRYFLETKQGLSFARNRGVKESNGEIVAFTDDDCIIDKKWVLSLYQTFEKYGADLVGGKSLPIWPQTPPKWLFSNYILGKLSLLDYGENGFRILSKDKELYGCNIAFKKSELIEAGLFNKDLGRKGNVLFAGEETELFLKFLFSSKIIYYQPKAVVYHKVLAERLKKNFFRKRCFSGGRTTVRMGKGEFKCIPYLKIPKFLFRDLLVTGYSWFISLFLFKTDRRFLYELEIAYILGRIYENFILKNKLLQSNKCHN